MYRLRGTNPIKELGDGGGSLIKGIERTREERIIRRLFARFFNVEKTMAGLEAGILVILYSSTGRGWD